ncbi:MAG: tRNA pseudouridine(55) synthase TruB [Terriglobales bacterium]|jgi:tRNA pseudouridine55 synthase
MNGVLVVDKPAGMTSHDVVNRVRRMLGQRSVGHLGTLDPSATGVLPLVVGSFTRLAKFYTHCEKGYEGEIRFGFATDTYDADGEATTAAQEVRLERGQIEALAESFLGTVEQMPPPFSAKKIGGVPAYKLARKQREVALKAVPVEIKEFTILEVEGDWVTFRARVGSGTYMRSIAHDMGQKIGCGAHLARLGRTAVAEFGLAEAHGLEAVDLAVRQGTAEDLFVHPRKLLPEMASVTANDEAVAFIRAGRAVNLPEMSRAPLVKVFYGQRELVAIATRIAGTLFHAGMVLGNREVEEARDSTRRFGRDW